jgi:hypothetical protein
LEAEKAEKAARKALDTAAKKAEKESKKQKKDTKEEANPASQVEVEKEPDIVKKIEFEGIKYLRSKNTGIIYNMEQDVVGKWNEDKNRIDFNTENEEEDEEEYEDDEDN